MGNSERFVSETEIAIAMTDPPQNTRAKGRGALVQKVIERKSPRYYFFDWNGAALDRNTTIEMPDPFQTYCD